MIHAEDVMSMLVVAAPSFGEKWAVLAEDVEGDGSRLHYADAGEFARHLLDLRREGAVGEITAAFAVIEAMHVDGDDDVRTLATIGYLEGVQNCCSHADDVSARDFEPFLGRESRRHWDALNDFWAGGGGS